VFGFQLLINENAKSSLTDQAKQWQKKVRQLYPEYSGPIYFSLNHKNLKEPPRFLQSKI
jgi:hypothetical protein